jgi:hypothetical protein
MKHTLKDPSRIEDGHTILALPFIVPNHELSAMRRNTSWTTQETQAAKTLLSLGMTPLQIANHLFRTEGAVSSHFNQCGLGYSLDPENSRVYNVPKNFTPSDLVLPIDGAPSVRGDVPSIKDPLRPTPRHHAKLIIAWAKGHEIECLPDCSTEWGETDDPSFIPECSYRIKPGPMPSPEELADAILAVSAGRAINTDLQYRLEMARVNVVSWSVARQAEQVREIANGFAAP